MDEAARRRWLLVFLLSVLAILLGMGYGIWTFVRGVIQATQELNARGVSLVRCLGDRACNRWYQERVVSGFDENLPYYLLPLVPLAALARAKMSEKPRKAPGTSRYAQKADLGRYLHGRERSGWLGLYEGRPLRYPSRTRFAHTLVLGQPGAGKTSRFYEPNLVMDALDGNSVVVVDLKWPNTQGFPRFIPLFENAGHRIELFLPYTLGSKKLPLLRDAADPLVAMEIAEGIIPVDQRATAMTYYKDQERAILSTLLRLEATVGSGSLGRLVRLLKRGPEAVEEFVESLGDDRAKEEIGFFLDLTPNQKTGLVAGLLGKLQPFDDPRLERATGRGGEEEEIDVARIAREPTFFYIGIPQDQLMEGVGQVFLQMIVRYINRTLLREARNHGGRCPVPVIIYLDEWANLGYLPGMDVMLATVRERRIAYILTLQNLHQGIKDYGEPEFKAILNNLGHWVIFPYAISIEDRIYLSEFLGQTTAYERTVAQGWKGAIPIFDPRLQVAEKEVARPFLAPMEMNEFTEGQGLVFGPGIYPVKVWLPRVDEPQIGGHRNPLYPYGKHLGALREQPDEVMAEVEKHLFPVDSEEETTPLVRFREWAEAVVNGEYRVHLGRNPHTLELTKVQVNRETLPEPLGTPPFFPEWKRQGWVRFEKNEKAIAITPKGLEVLPVETVRGLERLGLAWKLVDWVKKHREHIQGLGEQVDLPLAYFEEATLTIPEGAFKEIFGPEAPRVRELMPLKNTQRKGIKSVKLPAVVEYLWDSQSEGESAKGAEMVVEKAKGEGSGDKGDKAERENRKGVSPEVSGTQGSRSPRSGDSGLDWLFE
ncbi:type IV secretory system conjugative DNA transfer family protein [Thermus caldilimi]|uniref:type IV secretory system conjugative DNA transfer family protein n=1 Tax=Thermus caldilimi TaxID=2483360 RepID=UPI0010763588|nr:type IV secretory system conjugative DNA transfer family protein [Thermus caldilimi]